MNYRIITLALLSATALVACSSNEPLTKKLDYKSAQPKRNALEIPPDLTNPDLRDKFALPKVNGAVTASSLAEKAVDKNREISQSTGQVAVQVPNMRIERQGNQRWLLIEKSPEDLWSSLEEFWQENGFLIKTSDPKLGVMETDWAENRAKIPVDGIRILLSKVGLDGLYSTPERDKFRIRLERGTKGTEVYFSHRGMAEVYTSDAKEGTIWQVRPADPELEAEMLGRFMLRLGISEDKARDAVKKIASASTVSQRSKIVGQTVVVDDAFDRAWRRTGLALDRVGLVVVDRNRQDGVYFVRLAQSEAAEKESGESIWSALAFWREKQPKKVQAQLEQAGGERFRVVLKEVGGNQTQVSVMDGAGQLLDEQKLAKILKNLNQQLQ